MTEYIVLVASEEAWELKAQVPARSARAAIRAHLDTETDIPLTQTETFVAVPARSWKPVTVKVETKTALKFS